MCLPIYRGNTFFSLRNTNEVKPLWVNLENTDVNVEVEPFSIDVEGNTKVEVKSLNVIGVHGLDTTRNVEDYVNAS